ncbi:MAG TPA: hypothetical protein VJ909_09455 [Prolixibacteraceae bacterium]|nr:hypothetical protein [Prolixibacteraceae bacterium]
MARFRRQKSRRNLKGGSDKPKILLRGYRRQLAFFIPWTLENKVFPKIFSSGWRDFAGRKAGAIF